MKKVGIRERILIGIRSTFFGAILVWGLLGTHVLSADRPRFVQVAIVFALYSIAIICGNLFDAKRSKLYYYLALPMDIAVMAVLTRITGGVDSVFYAGFFVAAGSFTLTFGLAPGIVASLICVVSLGLANYEEIMTTNYIDFTFRGAAIVTFGLVIGMLAEMLWRRIDEDDQEVKNLQIGAEKMQRQIRELRAVSDVASLVHSTLDLDRLSGLVIEVLTTVFEMDVCSLSIINKRTGQSIFSAERGLEGKEADSFRKKVFSTEFDAAVGMQEQAFLKCLVLLDEEDMTAILYTTEEVANRLQKDDFQIMTSIATQLLVAVENVRLYELTKKYSITDELTQLYNYRYLQQELRQEVGRSKRYDRPVSLIMIDVDYFKKYNDTYGHIKGDAVLAEIAMLLKGCCREIDKVARYGGEEFAIVLPETDSTGAYIVAEKMREAIASHQFTGTGSTRDARLTISLGVASYPEHASGQEDLLKAADNALYLAKNQGRNRTLGPESSNHKAS